MKNISNGDLKEMFKNDCFKDLILFRNWILIIRKYFIEQELIDVEDEIICFKFFWCFIMCIDRMVLYCKIVLDIFKSSLGDVENFLKGGKKLKFDENIYLEKVLKDLEKEFFVSGFGILEEE